MITKFDRLQIANINSAHLTNDKNNNVLHPNRHIAVPQQDTFKYVFNNAKKGNEFAAVLLDEWQNGCRPKNEEEQQVIDLIKKATNKLFK